MRSETENLSGPVATIDTSVLLSLQCTGTIGAVSVLFERLLVPQAVRNEIDAGGERNAAILQALATYGLFESCDDYDWASVEFLLQQRTERQQGRDQGEAEAIVQAVKRSADMVLVDDALGREWAKNMLVDCHGTLWIFEQLRIRGYLLELRPHFLGLLRNRRRQPLSVMNDLLAHFRELEIFPSDF